MLDDKLGEAQGAIARRLNELLARPGPYRTRWERRGKRSPDGRLNQAAIATVVAEYLWDSGERSDEEQGLPRGLKDRVGRALHGEVITPRTLGWFIEAFAMSPADIESLWYAAAGPVTDRVVRGGAVPDVALPPPRARTVSLHEFHVVGADGTAVEHRTVQVLEALVDGFACYPYRFDAEVAEVQVLHGARASRPRRDDDGIWRVELELLRPLTRGETLPLEYRTVFRSPGPAEARFRRVILRRAENLAITVTFHPSRLPARVWWATWDGLEGPVLSREDVALDPEHGVHRFLSAIEQATVGFTWAW